MNSIPNDLICAQIRRYVDFSEIIPITKGYSPDLKYLMIAKNGKKYLVRITESDDIKELTSRRDQFSLMKELREYSPLVPETYHFFMVDNPGSCVMILGYIEGVDGEEGLGRLSEEDQYRIGYQAGRELKKLHQYPAPSDYKPWDILKQRKHERYRAWFARDPILPEGIDLDVVEQFISDHIHLMKNTESVFQHDDYHPANLIIQNGCLKGIIDFNRCDWGDPIHDFYKVALFTRNISIPFSRGQIDGYYNGSVPPDFWDRYALYCAMSFIPDLVWSGKIDLMNVQRTQPTSELKKSVQRLRTIYEDHEGFSRVIPRWYE